MHCFYLSSQIALTGYWFVLVQDSCMATVRNGNSISTDCRYYTIKTYITTLVSALLWQSGIFFTLKIKHYTYIVRKCKIHLHSLQSRTEKLANGFLFYLFLKLGPINDDNERKFTSCLNVMTLGRSILYIEWICLNALYTRSILNMKMYRCMN